MRVFKSLIACAAILLLGNRAFADVIDDDTKCRKVVTATPSADTQTSEEIVKYVLATFRAIDHLHNLRNQVEILPQMTAEGQSLLALLVLDRCRSRGDMYIADIAVETYEGVRGRRDSLALNGRLPVNDVRRVTRKKLRTIAYNTKSN
jgi:hypothetical protein